MTRGISRQPHFQCTRRHRIQCVRADSGHIVFFSVHRFHDCVIPPGVKLKPIWYTHVPLIRSTFERKSLIKTSVEILDSLTKVILDSEISLTKVHTNINFP